MANKFSMFKNNPALKFFAAGLGILLICVLIAVLLVNIIIQIKKLL